ncbi:MAG: hypothetical protein QXX07_02635 [Candidatus Aenigmatarchaeota archaeon]
MSVEKLEEAISKFRIHIFTLINEPSFLPYALGSFSEFGGYFPQLQKTEEYKKLERILKSLQTPIKGKITYKLHSKEMASYAGKLVAEANQIVEGIKKTQKPPEKHKIEKKVREPIYVEIPPSGWEEVLKLANKLSDAMWGIDEYKIRKILPIVRKLKDGLRKVGDPENFIEELEELTQELYRKKERGGLTITQLRQVEPSYVPTDEKLKTLLTEIKEYAESQIK